MISSASADKSGGLVAVPPKCSDMSPNSLARWLTKPLNFINWSIYIAYLEFGGFKPPEKVEWWLRKPSQILILSSLVDINYITNISCD